MSEKKYKVGYCPGAFDLFHIGHLNLIMRSKERCEYLIVGVVTDELYFKQKKKIPFISLEERMKIVESIKYVDKVIAVDERLNNKLTALSELHYDCHFSGSDHIEQWKKTIEEANKQGAQFEFFDYTQSTCSTRIRSVLEQKSMFNYMYKSIMDKTIVILGTGKLFDDYMEKYGVDYKPSFAVDNNEDLWGTQKCGIEIKSPNEILNIPQEDLWLFICTANSDEIENQVTDMGIKDYRVYKKINNDYAIPNEYMIK